MVSIAFMGHGVVGSGVAEVLLTNADSITKKAGDGIEVKHILDLRDFPDSPLCDRFTKDFNDILNDDSVKIVAEAMGGVNPAFDFTAQCLAAGKHVVTSNKELVSTRGLELLKIAKEHNVNYLFEASVGGGIPLIRPLVFCLAGNEIESINGILNGTTNFILTKMIHENLTFEEALKIAQDNGYAEKDPTADVEGIDACRKIAILSSLASNTWIDPEKVHTEGITRITLEDVAYAGNCECVIKLISTMEKLDDGRYYIVVSPAIVSKESQLASIDGVFNGALVTGDNVGDVVFYGQGAGKLATASAVVGDIVDCANHDLERRMIGWGDEAEGLVADPMEVPNRYYIRLKVEDPDLAQKEIRSSFGDIYLLARSGAFNTELAFLTAEFTEREVREKIDGLTSAKLKSFIRLARC